VTVCVQVNHVCIMSYN